MNYIDCLSLPLKIAETFVNTALVRAISVRWRCQFKCDSEYPADNPQLNWNCTNFAFVFDFNLKIFILMSSHTDELMKKLVFWHKNDGCLIDWNELDQAFSGQFQALKRLESVNKICFVWKMKWKFKKKLTQMSALTASQSRSISWVICCARFTIFLPGMIVFF